MDSDAEKKVDKGLNEELEAFKARMVYKKLLATRVRTGERLLRVEVNLEKKYKKLNASCKRLLGSLFDVRHRISRIADGRKLLIGKAENGEISPDAMDASELEIGKQWQEFSSEASELAELFGKLSVKASKYRAIAELGAEVNQLDVAVPKTLGEQVSTKGPTMEEFEANEKQVLEKLQAKAAKQRLEKAAEASANPSANPSAS